MERKELKNLIEKVTNLYEINSNIIDNDFLMDNLDIINLKRIPSYKLSSISFEDMNQLLNNGNEIKNILDYIKGRCYSNDIEQVPDYFIDNHYLLILDDLKNNCNSNIHHCNSFLIYLLKVAIKNNYKFIKWRLDSISKECYDDDISQFIDNNKDCLIEK